MTAEPAASAKSAGSVIGTCSISIEVRFKPSISDRRTISESFKLVVDVVLIVEVVLIVVASVVVEVIVVDVVVEVVVVVIVVVGLFVVVPVLKY